MKRAQEYLTMAAAFLYNIYFYNIDKSDFEIHAAIGCGILVYTIVRATIIWRHNFSVIVLRWGTFIVYVGLILATFGRQSASIYFVGYAALCLIVLVLAVMHRIGMYIDRHSNCLVLIIIRDHMKWRKSKVSD